MCHFLSLHNDHADDLDKQHLASTGLIKNYGSHKHRCSMNSDDGDGRAFPQGSIFCVRKLTGSEAGSVCTINDHLRCVLLRSEPAS